MKTLIETPDQLIDALGGTSELAKKLGVGLSTVSNYRKRGFAGPHAVKLFYYASIEKLNFDRKLFGLE